MRPGELSDIEGFRAAARRARWLGFDGVDFFHPGFVGIANEVFSPSAEELAWADRLLEFMSARGSDATASAKLDGRAVLPQHVELAHRLRDMANEVAQR
jgi:citrate lyase subunit beta/citryl-CoA lyase